MQRVNSKHFLTREAAEQVLSIIEHNSRMLGDQHFECPRLQGTNTRSTVTLIHRWLKMAALCADSCQQYNGTLEEFREKVIYKTVLMVDPAGRDSHLLKSTFTGTAKEQRERRANHSFFRSEMIQIMDALCRTYQENHIADPSGLLPATETHSLHDLLVGSRACS